jgi:cell wall-associated NlpC family hydrolase
VPIRSALRPAAATALCAIVLLGARGSRAAAQSGQIGQIGQIGQSAAVEAPDKPFAALSNSAETLRDSIVAMAKAQVGTRYKRGGASPDNGFDCSGLVQYVMSALQLDVPRTARQQAKAGSAVVRDTSRLLPGDLLTFARGKRSVSHVAIYIGNGQYVHASTKAGKVIVSSMTDRPLSPLLKMWRGARRLLSLDDTTSTVVLAARPDTTGR